MAFAISGGELPIYEYRCSEDGHTLETVASLEDTITCPDCGRAMDRQFPTRHIVVFGQGASLADCHDIAIEKMEANGELDY